MTSYRYCLFNRPLGIGAQPKGVVATEPRPAEGEDWYEIARHGFVIYDRKLTHDEEKAFELPPILGQDDLDALAQDVAASYAKYRGDIVEMLANKERAWVAANFTEKARRMYPGYAPALPEGFPAQVYRYLTTDKGHE